MKKINSLPILLKNPKILLIGGGKVALQKAKVLADNEIEFQVISETICDELKNLGVHYNIKSFERNNADNFNIVIDATGNKNVNVMMK